ncbi:MAG: hypothetical protein Q9O74_03150 [Planctomycetota bacterium]|nr:hypothetical protein [Planctomycetota bacterium]
MPSHRPDPTNPPEALPIVVGAHVCAEVEDRPIAVALRDALADRAPAGFPFAPIVLTDVWYLNTDALRAQPTISIGRPEVNALSAYLADKLPSVLAADDRFVVLLDPELADPAACCWGVDAGATAEAVRAFAERWAEVFLTAATRT